MLANICPGYCEACTCPLQGTSRQMLNISYDSLTCMWGKSPRPSLDSSIKMYTGLLDSGDEMFQELPAFIVLLVLQCNIKLMSTDVHYHPATIPFFILPWTRRWGNDRTLKDPPFLTAQLLTPDQLAGHTQHILSLCKPPTHTHTHPCSLY